MTDPLTDAVRRLKELQADVERLKAGQDEEGEPRIFIQERERAIASDRRSIRAADIATFETATAADAQQPPVGETVASFYYNTTEAGWNALEYPDS